jgi:hypothetical protein
VHQRAPAPPTETSSGASATDGPGRICHLRLDHLQSIVPVSAGQVSHSLAQLGPDRARVAVVTRSGVMPVTAIAERQSAMTSWTMLQETHLGWC